MQPPSWPSTSCVWPRRCFRRNLPSLRTWQGLPPRLSSQHHIRQTGRHRGALEARARLAAWNGSGMLAPERTRSPALGAGLSPGAAGKDKGAESGLRFCLWTWGAGGALGHTVFFGRGLLPLALSGAGRDTQQGSPHRDPRVLSPGRCPSSGPGMPTCPLGWTCGEDLSLAHDPLG